jgi:hypothetical protein
MWYGSNHLHKGCPQRGNRSSTQLEKSTDLETFYSLASNIISHGIEINSVVEDDKVEQRIYRPIASA